MSVVNMPVVNFSVVNMPFVNKSVINMSVVNISVVNMPVVNISVVSMPVLICQLTICQLSICQLSKCQLSTCQLSIWPMGKDQGRSMTWIGNKFKKNFAIILVHNCNNFPFTSSYEFIFCKFILNRSSDRSMEV